MLVDLSAGEPVCLVLCLSTDTHTLCVCCLHIIHQPKSIKTRFQEKTCLSQKNLEKEVPFVALPFNVPQITTANT